MAEKKAQDPAPDGTAALQARIAELESQLDEAEKRGQDARVDQLQSRIDALEKRLEDAEPSAEEESEPEPEEGVVLDASPDAPSESGGEQSQDAPAPRTVTKRVGGRWRTWTENEEGATEGSVSHA